MDQYQKDTCFYYEEAYCYYDIDVDKILLYQKSGNEYYIRYKHLNKMDIEPLQLKIKTFSNEIRGYNNGDEMICIENSDEEFFQKFREIWNKIIELIKINNAPNFIQTNLDDNSEFNEANVLENTNFVISNCDKDELIIALHFVVNKILKYHY